MAGLRCDERQMGHRSMYYEGAKPTRCNVAQTSRSPYELAPYQEVESGNVKNARWITNKLVKHCVADHV